MAEKSIKEANRKADATPEEIEAMRLKKYEQNRRYRQKRKAEATPEEIEAIRLSKIEENRQYRQKRDKEEFILKQDAELLSQNQTLSLQENEIVRKAGEIKNKRLMKNQHYGRLKAAATTEEGKTMKLKNLEQTWHSRRNRKTVAKPEETEAMILKNSEQTRQYRRKQKAAATSGKIEAMRLKKIELNRQYRQEKRENEESILKKAMELHSQNQELLLEEKEIVRKAEEIKAKRLIMSENRQKRKAAASSEQLEAIRLRNMECMRRYRQKRKAAATPEEKELRRLKQLELNRQYRQTRDKEEFILKKAAELLSQNQTLSLQENEIVKKAGEIKDKRLKKNQHHGKSKAAATPEEEEAMKLKNLEQTRRSRRNRKTAATFEETKTMRLTKLEKSRQYRQKQKAAATPEKLEAMRLKKIELNRQYREKQKSTATPEENIVNKLKLKFDRKRQYRQKRDKEEFILKKAMQLLSQNNEMSIEENVIVRKAEEIKANRLKSIEKVKQYRKKQKAAATPEKIETMRLQQLELDPQYRQEKRENEEQLIRKAMELHSQNQELSLEEKEIVRKAEEIKAKRLIISEYHHKRKATATSAKLEAIRLRNIEHAGRHRQKLKAAEAAATPEEKEAIKLKNVEQQRRYRLNRKAAATPDQLEERRLKNLEQIRLTRQKRKAAATPEEIEAMRLKQLELKRQYRQEKRENEESILRKAMELHSQNQDLSLKEKEIVRKAEEIKAKQMIMSENRHKRKAAATSEKLEAIRLRNIEHARLHRQKLKAAEAAATPEEKEAMRFERLKRSRKYRQNNREKEELRLAEEIRAIRCKSEHIKQYTRKNASKILGKNEVGSFAKSKYVKQYTRKNASERLTRRKDQFTSNVPSVLDEIKIEEEVLQESIIKAIPARQNVNSILDESWFELSENSITGENSQSNTNFPSFYGGSSSISKSFSNINGHSTKIDRRKSGLGESFRCMRVLIDATAKRNGLAVFGKQIAQKLRTSKKDLGEVGIAKQLINNVLRNLAIGAYNSITVNVTKPC